MQDSAVLLEFSALGRPIDLRYRSNVAVVITATVVAVAFGVYNLVSATPLDTSWVEAAVGVFLAWAIARELDPDNGLSAAVAMVVSVGISVVAAPSLLASFGLLLATRLTTGSVGVALRRFDPVVLVIGGALLGSHPSAPAAIPALVAGIVLAGNRSGHSMAVAAATTVGAAVSLAVTQPLVVSGTPGRWAIGFLILAVLALAAVVPAEAPTSPTDAGDKALLGWRVSMSRVAVAVTIAVAFVIGGESGIAAFSATGAAALTGVALVRLAQR